MQFRQEPISYEFYEWCILPVKHPCLYNKSMTFQIVSILLFRGDVILKPAI